MRRQQKEKLKENLEKLDADEHAQVFAIIKKYTDNFTKTQNGVLISSDNLTDECLLEMEKMVQYYLDQRKTMDFGRVNRRQ
jgi:Bromodomain extra-terminal - transcription regulation